MSPKQTGSFSAGDKVQLTGPKGRINTIVLAKGGTFGTHRGDLRHDDIIGLPDGSVVANQNGVEYLALKPLLNDFVSLLKDTGLVSILGVTDAVRAAQINASRTFNYTPYVVAAILFLLITIPMTRYTDRAIRQRTSAQNSEGAI